MSGIEAFLGTIVDYAGLFPPAQLSLEQAVANYVRYRATGEAWLLGRFVCPANRLLDLRTLDAFPPGIPMALAVLGRGGKDAHEYFANVKQDLADIALLRAHLGDRVKIDTYEVRLPPSAFQPLRSHQLSSFIATTAYLIETGVPELITPFFEAADTERSAVLAVIQSLHDDRHSREARGRRHCQPAGLKLRTGGLEAAAFPSCGQVALALAACSAARVPFKATAGLHHPIRHFSAAVNAPMHGFVNVFAAGCLAFCHGLDEGKVRAILEEEDAHHFAADARGLRWRELTAPVETLVAARQLFTSFGSCSFEEPCADLRQMHWLA